MLQLSHLVEEKKENTECDQRQTQPLLLRHSTGSKVCELWESKFTIPLCSFKKAVLSKRDHNENYSLIM